MVANISRVDDACDPLTPLRCPAPLRGPAAERSVMKPEAVISTGGRPTLAVSSDVTFARAEPSDGPAIEAMLERCSRKSMSNRFFRPVPRAPHGYLLKALSDRAAHLAFLIQMRGHVIGLAELHRTGSRSGDLGLIVEDAYQLGGVGTAAYGLLTRIARMLDLQVLTADVRVENSHILRALRRAGRTSVTRDCDVCHVEVHI
jgi:hypothetical protein